MAAANRTLDWLRRRPVLADVGFAVVLLVLGIIATANAELEATEREIDAFGWILLAGTCLPVATRRIYPVASAWAMLGANAPYWVLDYPDQATGLTLLIGVYSVAAHVDRPGSVKHGVGL
ncbi:MAG: hypothetical protein AAGE98_22640, partial [Actinomycetota bacterium]